MGVTKAFTATATADIGLWIGNCAPRDDSWRWQAVCNPGTGALAHPVLPAFGDDMAAADTLAATA